MQSRVCFKDIFSVFCTVLIRTYGVVKRLVSSDAVTTRDVVQSRSQERLNVAHTELH